MPLILSIDFEDMAHDMKRDLGLWETGPIRTEALWQSYHDIDDFLRAHGGARGRKATFFCTGLIAEQAPDLIARIAADGHEIACHYHFHDRMDGQDVATIDRMLGRARTALEDASGTSVRGFRAPQFRIDRTGPAQYQAVMRHFDYDSSFPAESREEVAAFRAAMGLGDFPILPIYRGRVMGRHFRLGGSYLKLFPGVMARRLIADAEKAGFAPHIYLHPYEFTASGSYRLSFGERLPLGMARTLYWGVRQEQWHRAGNRGLPAKLARLIGHDGLAGRLGDLVPAIRA
ncbi:polysaccharide deacetylase family protein [Paracoccus methylarcula]|uniref:Chitooligosaccharide deacetylase n=1 Tax=Paracoccus methylarcula TaxID=72022 RepID=A0A422QXJ3_9RHOB|nr:polysaccharide deacetylase family protein [Paracoccus methylarcula]RNF34702.1 DUF3473 domain-containing protein [Paracoccus methylarcula]